MHAIDKLRVETKIIPITLAAAVVVGVLSFYVFEGTDAAFAGAGIVTTVGFWVNARATNERDRVSGVRFSLSQLLEFIVAFALVVWGFPIVKSFSALSELYPSTIVFVMFYVFKLLLTFSITTENGASNGKSTNLIFVPYSLLTVGTILILEWPYDQPSLSGMELLIWLIAWFPVPTTTFFLDIRAKARPAPRYVVWRSVIEILFVCPFVCAVAVFFIPLVAMVTGLWPAGF